MKAFIFLLLIAVTAPAAAQELFVYTEPASNMPAHSIGLRLNNWLMVERGASNLNYHLVPEVMWGVNKNLMLHAEAFLSNRNKAFTAEGAGLYAKYRILSKDALNRHFRMAAYGRLAFNNSDIHMEEIEINGHNSGFEAGLIATQLLHRTALSATASFEQARNNGAGNELPQHFNRNAVNYSLSAGHLFYPKTYTTYKQTNINAMLEVLGQANTGSGRYYIDAAPALQFIFNSQTRLDVGYKFELAGTLQRTAPNGLLIRVEHLLFNAL